MSLVGAPAWGMAAEHKHPRLLGNRGSRPNPQALEAVVAYRGQNASSMSPIRHWRTLSPSRHTRGSRVCPGWMVASAPKLRIAERQHESQQHLPQQRTRLLADGATSAERPGQALLPHVSAILPKP